jgi:transporter family protein
MRRIVIVAVVVTTFSWGISQLMDKLSVDSLDQMSEANAMLARQVMALGMILAWGAVSGKIRDIPRAPLRAWVLLAVSGGMGVAIGGLAYFFALRAGNISTVAVFTSGYPLVTLILAAIILGERLTTMKVVGTLLVLGGLTLLSV